LACRGARHRAVARARPRRERALRPPPPRAGDVDRPPPPLRPVTNPPLGARVRRGLLSTAPMAADPTPPASAGDVTLRRLVAVLAVIFVVAALKAAKPVAMSLAFALFFLVLFWPLHVRLDRVLPKGLALVLTFLALLAVLGLFVGAVWFTAGEVAEQAPRYEAAFETMRAEVASIFGALGGAGGDGGAALTGE